MINILLDVDMSSAGFPHLLTYDYSLDNSFVEESISYELLGPKTQCVVLSQAQGHDLKHVRANPVPCGTPVIVCPTVILAAATAPFSNWICSRLG
ncbi:BQ5605_C034g11305 [Microbotryum silenes-dioicae]|uniref:BQ5605_C034g11305 protein n=1 Tax=Microbotryum silenes-dioicae TaxID=796604 RepID=A0A2X0N9N2_9BASI|nr:BQ5605_C034g11305 [Microbotryum silenes-dioicae]